MAQLSRTPESDRKQARIAEVDQEIKLKRRNIKGIRTRLKNTKDKIRQMYGQQASSMDRVMERFVTVQRRFAAAAKALLEREDIPKTMGQQMFLESNIGSIENSPLDQIEEMMGQMNAEPDPEAKRPGPEEFFAQFSQEPAQEEKRDMRQLYLKLSQQFHPDKARNDQETKRNHEMMKRISQAYEAHDIEALLEMERLYLDEEMADIDLGTPEANNLLDAQIERKERELLHLTHQYDRLSMELKSIRKSDAGQDLTHFDRTKRDGLDIERETEALLSELEGLTELTEAIKASLEAKAITPQLDELITGSMNMFVDEDDEDLEGLDMMDMLSAMMGEEADEVDWSKAKYKEGEIVHFQMAMPHEPRKPISTTGMIQEVLFDHDLASFGYRIIPQPDILQALPPEWIARMVQQKEDFCYVDILENALLKRAKKKDFDQKVAQKLARGLIWDHILGNATLSAADKQAMRDFMMAIPEEPDARNLKKAINPLTFPGEYKVTLLPNPYPHIPRTKRHITFLGINEFDENDGLIAFLDDRGHDFLLPLQYLRFKKLSYEQKETLRLYQLWVELRLPDPIQNIFDMFGRGRGGF